MLSIKKIFLISFSCFLIIGLTCFTSKAQTSPVATPVLGISNPWTDSQLMEPTALAGNFKDAGSISPVIFNIGAVEDIKGAEHIGAVNNTENLEKFKDKIAAMPKNTEIVIYCGCCPFSKCPNIRPAFNLLKKLGFTNIKVLDLPANLKTDWIAKGYPMASK
jgi:rhodanese-related sulfurtransferase